MRDLGLRCWLDNGLDEARHQRRVRPDPNMKGRRARARQLQVEFLTDA
ncbi:MAG: hypothetical protein ACI9U2_005132, partial [Bradymonadia bacterium]